MIEIASEIDKKNSDTLWEDVLENKISMSRKALKIPEDCAGPAPGGSFVGCHVMFDVKLGNFSQEA